MGKRKDSKGRILKQGEGQRANGTYDYRWTDTHGKHHSIYAPTLQELREREAEIARDILDGIDSASGDITVAELAERHIGLKQGLKKNTVRTYENALKRIKEEDFGCRKIRTVKKTDAKMWFVALHDAGLKRSTIETIQNVLRPAFEMAVEDDAIRKNPFKFSVAEIIPNDTAEKAILSPLQEARYLQMEEEYRQLGYADDIIILMQTGLRVSELYGLTKDDVDLDGKRIYVRRQLQRDAENGYYVTSPKSAQGVRTIPMTDSVRDALRRVIQSRKRGGIERIIDGCSGFLFLTRTGSPKTSISLENHMRSMKARYEKRYGEVLPNITPHSLRHGFCTQMARAGMPDKERSVLMGHSKVSVTQDVYTHTDDKTVESAFYEAMGKIG